MTLTMIVGVVKCKKTLIIKQTTIQKNQHDKVFNELSNNAMALNERKKQTYKIKENTTIFFAIDSYSQNQRQQLF